MTMKPKTQKRIEAESRQSLRDQKSDKEQLLIIGQRRGQSRKERDRLLRRTRVGR